MVGNLKRRSIKITAPILELLSFFELTYLIELEAELDERLVRNKTPLRLGHKPTKQNIEWSEKDLTNSMKKYRLYSLPGEIKRIT